MFLKFPHMFPKIFSKNSTHLFNFPHSSSTSPNKLVPIKFQSSFLWAEWTSNHQCTSWPFYPLDRLRFFIQRQMGFITVHFFLLLTTVLFFSFLVPDRFSRGPNLPPCSLSYLHKYSTNLDTLFIMPYWHSYPNN